MSVNTAHRRVNQHNNTGKGPNLFVIRFSQLQRKNYPFKKYILLKYRYITYYCITYM